MIEVRRLSGEAELARAAELCALSSAAFWWRPSAGSAVDFFRRCLPEEVVWAAFDNGGMAGVISMSSPSHIHFLFVAPDRMRSGIGRALIDHVRSAVQGRLTLKVDVHNADAIAFYERLGWQRSHGEPDSTGSDDGVAWIKYLG